MAGKAGTKAGSLSVDVPANTGTKVVLAGGEEEDRGEAAHHQPEVNAGAPRRSVADSADARWVTEGSLASSGPNWRRDIFGADYCGTISGSLAWAVILLTGLGGRRDRPCDCVS